MGSSQKHTKNLLKIGIQEKENKNGNYKRFKENVRKYDV